MTRTGKAHSAGRTVGIAALAAVLGWHASALASGQPGIEAEVSSETVGVGEQFTYTLSLTNAEGGSLENPKFGQLTVIQGPSKSSQSSIMIMNGQTQATTTLNYTWVLEAPNEGRFTIGAAKLQIRGQSLESNAVEVTCSGQAPPPRPAPRRSNPFDPFSNDPFDAFDNFPGFQQPQRGHGDSDVFLRAVVDKTDAYLGEQVTLSIYAYTQTPISSVQNLSSPKLDGFWTEELESPTQLAGEQKIIHGQQYTVYMLRRRALFPLRAGELTIDGFEAEIGLGVSMFFGAAPESVKRKAAPVKINVKPLPAAGQPPGFEASNVGSYTLTAQVPNHVAQLGQPIQLKVTLEGSGNIKGIRAPKPQLPAGLKTYDPTTTDKQKNIASRFGGTKTVEYVIIPERTGDFVIPPLELPMFDPAKGEYTVLRTQPVDIHVTPADNSAPVSSGGQVAAPSVSNVLSGGIRPIRIESAADVPSKPLWQRKIFWPLAGGPVAAWVVLLSGSAFIGTLRRRDPKRLKERRAHSAASRRLRAARAMLEANDANGLHAEVTRALQQFVTDKTAVAALGLTREELGRALMDRGYPAPNVRALVELLERCETARFSPGSSSPEQLAKLLDDANRTLDTLESIRPARAA